MYLNERFMYKLNPELFDDKQQYIYTVGFIPVTYIFLIPATDNILHTDSRKAYTSFRLLKFML
jgi:hypothetical protein